MLAQSSSVLYLHEPFRSGNDAPFSGLNCDHWFTYLTDENAQPYRAALQRICELDYSVEQVFSTDSSSENLQSRVQTYLRCLYYRACGGRALLKDPLAVLSADWLAQAFDMRVIVLVRHPAGFAGSLKKHEWTHPFSDFLAQPLLMEEVLAPFADEIRAFAAEERDIVDQAGLLWKMIYSTIDDYRERHNDWIVIRHEDLARDPVDQFSRLYRRLGLSFDAEVEETVRSHSKKKNPAETTNPVQLRRDSRSVIYNWTNRLTPEEIERVRRHTEPIASRFYAHGDWEY
jgi:hypothetical protein